jgi:hypothetical protein
MMRLLPQPPGKAVLCLANKSVRQDRTAGEPRAFPALTTGGALGLPSSSGRRSALEAAGIAFIAGNGGAAGLRLRKPAPPSFTWQSTSHQAPATGEQHRTLTGVNIL